MPSILVGASLGLSPASTAHVFPRTTSSERHHGTDLHHACWTPTELSEMKPRERPPASPSNDGRLLDGTLGSDPVHQDRPHHVGQTLWMLDGAIPIPKTIVSACGSGEEPPGCRHSSTTTVLRTARRRGDGWLGDVGRCYAVAAAYPAAVSVPQPIVGLTSQRCRIAYSKAASNWSSRPAWAAIFRIATLAIESHWPTPRGTSARTRRVAASRSIP
jgi:hypothetical protein